MSRFAEKSQAVGTTMASNPSLSERRALAVAGGVEIAGFPQLLLTREHGDPNALFLPLLKLSREAVSAARSVVPQGQDANQANMMSTIHLATALLKGLNFTLGSKGSPPQNYYLVDLDSEFLQLRTWLFATISKRTSTFLVKISGDIRTGVFRVKNGTDDSVLAEFDEQRMTQTENFFDVLSETSAPANDAGPLQAVRRSAGPACRGRSARAAAGGKRGAAHFFKKKNRDGAVGGYR